MSSTVVGQAPTNLGPLTTTFTPPPSCTVAVMARRGLFNRGEKDVAWMGQACERGKPIDDPSCWPETSKGAEEKEAPLHGWGFYSPGLHCPTGYATACSAIGGSGGESGWPVQFKLLDGETAVGCCPSGYGCGNDNGQTCIMVATSTMVPTVTCEGSKSGDFGFQTVPDADAEITAFSVFAPMIQINWQSSDQPKSTSTKSSKSKTKTSDGPDTTGTKTVDPDAASTGETLVLDGSPQTTGNSNGDGNGNDNIEFDDPSPTATLQENEEDSDEGATISSGAKTAIGVAGAAIGLVMLVCALFYFWRRRKSQREDQELDRLYGLKNTMSAGGDFTSSNEIPGWYRGQRLATPTTKDPFAEAGGGGGGFGGAAEVERPAPAAPYYRPYRQ